jgi:hypothetical protein
VQLFLERYVIPILAAATLLVVTGSTHLAWSVRILCALAAMVLAYLCAYAAHQLNKTKASKLEWSGSELNRTDVSSTTLADGRIVITFDPKYLTDFYKNNTALQADRLVRVFLGKWMKASGKVHDVSVSQFSGGTATVTFEYSDPFVMHFLPKDWLDRLSILRRGDKITVLGQITDVTRTIVVLNNCEVIDSTLP